jgi:hypothetical protein
MTRRYWLAGLAGAVAMFIWASVAHMTPMLATAGIQRMPNEPMVLAHLQSDMDMRGGLYIFPSAGPGDTSAAQARMAKSPSGLMLYRPPPARGMEPRQLIGEFLLELFETLVATALLSVTAIYGFAGRVRFFAGLGVLAAVATNGSYWLWYGFPAAFSLAAMLIEVVKFVVAGVVVALVLGKEPAEG